MVQRRTWMFLLAGLLIVVIVTTVVVGIYVGRGAGRGERVEVPENLPKNKTESTDGHGGGGKRAGRMNPWEINQKICPPVLCPNVAPVTGKELDGQLPGIDVEEPFGFFEGDIVLDETTKRSIESRMDQEHVLEHDVLERSSRGSQRHKRAIVKQEARLWTDGIVPYEVDHLLPFNTTVLIRKAIDHYETHTCIRFREKIDTDQHYISFEWQPGCWSFIGRVGGAQIVSLGPGCGYFGTIVHETGHALGFWHEQSRPDRNRFVRIIKRNIGASNLNQFTRLTRKESDPRGYAYDYGSIMHYGPDYYTANTKPTIRVIGIGKENHFEIGQRMSLSPIDMAQLRDMYQCNKKVDPQQNLCDKGWAYHKGSCYLFVADRKEHFADAHASCVSHNAHLLHVENKNENNFISRYVSVRYPNVDTWRTGGKKVDNNFVWFGQSENVTKEMSYTDWFPSYPGLYTSLGLTLFRGSPIRTIWTGIWEGSPEQKSFFTYPYICEKKRQGTCFTSQTGDGREYRGTRDFSQRGVMCQAWSAQYPHRHSRLTGEQTVDDSNGLGAHNFCRNPGGRRSRPWCYVLLEKREWQYCDIRIC